MTMRATSTFKLDSWEESAYDERDGTKLSRVKLTKTFSGDLDGTGRVEMLAAQGSVPDSRAYVALERITGTLNGRTGSFVLLHTATASNAGGSASWPVVPDSGTGDLRALRGQGQIAVSPDGAHTFTLDYELD